MYRYDDPTAVVALPTPAAPGTAGYFTDGNPASGSPATILRADFMNMIMLEVVNVVEAAGLTPSKVTYTQLRDSIQALISSASNNYVTDTGAANAYVVALTPPISSYSNGLTFRFRAVNANTGASTLNAGGGVIPLVRNDGSPLQAGDIPASGIITVNYDGPTTSFLVTSLVASQFGPLASLGIGAGLRNDGSGNLQVNLPPVAVNTTQTLAASAHDKIYLATGACTFNVAQSTTTWSGWGFEFQANGGAITITPNANDTIFVNGVSQTQGANYVIPQGTSGYLVANAAGSLFIATTTAALTATTSRAGIIQLATGTEVAALSNTTKAITPGTLASAFPGGLTANDRIVLPNGLIIQWAKGATDPANNTESTQTITFPTAFPTACVACFVSTGIASASNLVDIWYQVIGAPSASSVTLQRQYPTGGNATGATTTPSIIAIGK